MVLPPAREAYPPPMDVDEPITIEDYDAT